MKKYDENYDFQKMRNDLLEQRIEILKTGAKRTNVVSKTAAVVAALSLTTIIGNLITNDPEIALQSAGSCIAMASYAIGNAKLNKHYKDLVETTTDKLDEVEEITEATTLREQLKHYKSRLEYYKINYPTHFIAGLGFAESFLVSLLNAVNAASTNGTLSVLPLVLGSSVCGIVALGHAKLVKDSKSQIKYYEGLIEEKEPTEKGMTLK